MRCRPMNQKEVGQGFERFVFVFCSVCFQSVFCSVLFFAFSSLLYALSPLISTSFNREYSYNLFALYQHNSW